MAYAAYIAEADYTATYNGQAIDTADFARIALRASDEIDRLTFNRIRRIGLSNFDTDTQDAIKLATCSITEALALVEKDTDGGVVTTSEKVGSYSFSIDPASIEVLKADGIRRAKQYLWNTGLIAVAL